MAKDNDKGLYLPLKIDLNEWEKSLLEADADLQKEMRKMRAEASNFKLKYDIEIANAKAAGDNVRVLELENKKLNAVYDAQKRAVEALNEAYKKSAQEKGVDAKATQAIGRQLIRETRELERTKKQLDANSFNVGDVLKNKLDEAFPAVNKTKNAIAGITVALTGMGTAAKIAVAGLSGVGVAAGAIALAASGFEALTKHVEDIAKAGVAASDPIYQLRESLQSTYEDAEFLYNVTKVDGSSAESLKNALTKLDATLKNDKNGTNEATIALRKYGAELLNADGSVKGYRAQLEELSRAARTAAAAGQYGDFKAALPGALRSTEFDHLLLGLDSYAEKAKAATTASKIYYDELHLVTDWTNNLALAKEHLNAVRGGFAADAEVENLKDQVDTVKALTLVLNENKEQYKKLYGEVGNITKKWTEFKGAGEVAFNSILADAVKLINKISELTAGFKDLSQYVKLLPGGGFIVDYIFGKVKEAKEQIAAKKEEVKLERELGEVIAKNKKEELNKIDNNAGKDTNSEAKKQEAYIKLEKEMFELQASEYEKRIQQINDEKAAYIAAGVTEVDAARLFAMQKEKIDSEYYAKLKKEKETQAKQAEEMLKREVEMQKRAREEAISGAEGTLRSNLKLIRYIQKQRNAGTYNEADAKAYADRLYMRQNGFKNSDISALKEIGVGVVQEIANARDRLFGQFANVNPLETAQPVTNNNNVTINFDNTVLDNVSAMDLLANKVAAIIQPAIQRAMQGQGGSYGYTN